MPSIRQIYPDKYLRPDHLQGRRACITIQNVYVDQFWNERANEKQPALVIRMKGKKLPFILNKTQTFAIAAILDSEDYGEWSGGKLRLSPGEQRGKATIVVTAVDSDNPPPQPQVEHPDTDNEDGPSEQHPDADNVSVADHPDAEHPDGDASETDQPDAAAEQEVADESDE